jgi:hypothetical protein
MSAHYLGFVDRLGASPAARLRPVAESSADKTKWLPLSQDFPNSDVVSWWTIPKDLRKNSYWVFQIVESTTYKPEIKQHDEFRVKNDEPHPATQLLTLEGVGETATIRRALVVEGVPANECVSKNVYVRTAEGLFIGPFKLAIKDDRAFVAESDLDSPTALNELLISPTQLFSSNGITILPPLAPTMLFKKVGEVDLSADEIFLKRTLKDLKASSPKTLEDAKLTNRLIDQYVHSLAEKQLTALQRDRLARLKSFVQSTSADIQEIEGCLSLMMEWSKVRDEIEASKTKAIENALQEERNQISALTRTRDELAARKEALAKELKELELRAKTENRKQEALIKEFDESIRRKLEALQKDATDFLAGIPLIRAAMSSLEGKATSPSTNTPLITPPSSVERITRTDLLTRLKGHTANAALDWRTTASLLSTFVSGFVPILRGTQSNDYLAVVSACLSANRVFRLPLNAALLTSEDLSNALVVGDEGAMPLQAFLRNVRDAEGLVVLCLEGLNLCQVDALLMPLLTSYARLQRRTAQESETNIRIASSVGELPRNVLIAGTLIDSPLALPLSQALWELGALVEAPLRFDPSLSLYTNEVERKSSVSMVEASEWRLLTQEIEALQLNPTSMDRTVWALTNHCSKDYVWRTSALTKALQKLLADGPEQTRLLLHLAISLIPYALVNGVELGPLAKGAGAEATRADNLIESRKELFRGWGFESK